MKREVKRKVKRKPAGWERAVGQVGSARVTAQSTHEEAFVFGAASKGRCNTEISLSKQSKLAAYRHPYLALQPTTTPCRTPTHVFAHLPAPPPHHHQHLSLPTSTASQADSAPCPAPTYPCYTLTSFL